MKTEQFNQLHTICTLDGLCYSLDYMIDELVDGFDLPEEIAKGADELQESLHSFRQTIGKHVIDHQNDYIDKKED